jgi:hypothetical protein
MASSTPVSLVEDREAFHQLLARADKFGMSWSELLAPSASAELDPEQESEPEATPLPANWLLSHPKVLLEADGIYTAHISNRVLAEAVEDLVGKPVGSYVKINQTPSHCMASGGYCSSQVYYYVAGIYEDGSERIGVAVLPIQ